MALIIAFFLRVSSDFFQEVVDMKKFLCLTCGLIVYKLYSDYEVLKKK
jgi:hypothetical protein